jgi:diguanylate cyclase (GGDEF)-like protein
LTDRLAQSLSASKRSGCYGALMFMDLDNFKPLNDQYGHAVGDLVLIEVADRIRRCVREMDTVARFGGDEFVVILSELSKVKEESIALAIIVAEKIRAALAEQYNLTYQQENHPAISLQHHCASSIGVVLFQAEDDQEDILRYADTAMYQAKQGGRNRIRFYGQDET